MSDSKLKYPSWQAPLQEAVLEFGPRKVGGKNPKGRNRNFRAAAISSDTDHHGEREALADAASILRGLKKDKLSYPDWIQKQE